MLVDTPRILRLNKAGMPLDWLSWQDTAVLMAKSRILWTYGEPIITLHGGRSRLSGEQSILVLNSIIAIDGRVHRKQGNVPKLSNSLLFQRDGHLCMYCGNSQPGSKLTRDHVIPTSKGGTDIWTNCVAACKHCNQRKADSYPDDVGMKLLAVPYAPNMAEYLALTNQKRILADQMAFLRASSKTFRVA